MMDTHHHHHHHHPWLRLHCDRWHCVLNLDEEGTGEPSIAVTQNFVSRANLVLARAFLKERREQVTGVDGGPVLVRAYVLAATRM